MDHKHCYGKLSRSKPLIARWIPPAPPYPSTCKPGGSATASSLSAASGGVSMETSSCLLPLSVAAGSGGRGGVSLWTPFHLLPRERAPCCFLWVRDSAPVTSLSEAGRIDSQLASTQKSQSYLPLTTTAPAAAPAGSSVPHQRWGSCIHHCLRLSMPEAQNTARL